MEKSWQPGSSRLTFYVQSYLGGYLTDSRLFLFFKKCPSYKIYSTHPGTFNFSVVIWAPLTNPV